MSVPCRAALGAILLSASAASAQPFLEFTISSYANESFGLGNLPNLTLRFVFDAGSTPPAPVLSTVQLLSMRPDSPNMRTHAPGSLFIAYLDVAPLSEGSVSGTIDGWPHELSFSFNGGPAFDPDGSLNDDPAAYTGWTSGSVDFDTAEGMYDNFWSPQTGFFGGGRFAMEVREVPDPDPAPEGCGVADLAEPFGVLNFSDVVAYLGAFAGGCP